MKVLLTGATGYIGSFLLNKLLEAKYEVCVTMRTTSNTKRLGSSVNAINVATYSNDFDKLTDQIVSYKPDIVIHLATCYVDGDISREIDNLVSTNLQFSSHLLEAMKQCGCRHLINTGSYFQHGSDSNYQPKSFYAATKQAFEAIIDYYCTAEYISAITLKLTDVYGPYPRRKRFINSLL